jgi:hypothetical protein
MIPRPVQTEYTMREAPQIYHTSLQLACQVEPHTTVPRLAPGCHHPVTFRLDDKSLF